jgi:hypothetical protein
MSAAFARKEGIKLSLQQYCTPYVSRTIKGWKIRVRLCWTADDSLITSTNLETQATTWPALLTGLSNSTWHALYAQPVGDVAYATTTSDYDNAEDAVVLSYATASGSIMRISVPNPKDSIFLSDKMTVDPANSAVAAFNTAMNLGGDPTANYVVSTSSGSQAAIFLGGLRKRLRTRRKLNIWVRNPELSAPGI